MRSLGPAAGFVFFALLSFSLQASTQSASAPASTSTPSLAVPVQAAPGTIVLHANAKLVLVDVVVTNRDRAALGLERARFHVFEGGHEQTIASFDEHKPTGEQMIQAKLLELPPHTFTNIPIYPEASAVNVVLLDGLNTPGPDQMQVRKQMLEYLEKIQPGTSLAIFTLASRLRLVEGFTTDPAQLIKALQSSKTSPQVSPLLDSNGGAPLDSVIDDMAAMQSSDATGGVANAVASMQQFQADIVAYQTDLRVRMTLDAMNQLARYLSAIPGRKNLIWFSGSFPLALDPDETLQSPFQAMRNYGDDVRATSKLLSTARVAVYPVDARGLMNMPSFSASYKPSGNLATSKGVPTIARDNQKFMRQLFNEQGSMQQIAQETGGKEYVNTNGLKEAVADAVQNGSSYYTIGFVPSATSLDGQFHKIQVRLDEQGYKLEYRRGYYADLPDKPSQHTPAALNQLSQAAVHGAPAATQITFVVRALPASDPLIQAEKLPDGPSGELSASLKRPVHRYVVDLGIDAHGLAFEETPSGYRAGLEFALIAYDEDGKRLNFMNRSFYLTLTPARYAAAMAKGIPLRAAIDVPPGRCFLRMAIYDTVAGRVGSLELPVVATK